MMYMSNVNDILNMRWVSNDNISPEDKKKMDGMHNNPMLQALRANLPAEQRQCRIWSMKELGLRMPHDELPKDGRIRLVLLS